MCFVLKFMLITYLSLFFLTGRILITIYNILKYLSCINIAYDNNNEIHLKQIYNKVAISVSRSLNQTT